MQNIAGDRRVVLVSAALLWLFLACPLSSAPSSTAWAAEAKIGYVDIGKVFEGYQRTKASDATLERQGKQKEAEFEARMAELKKLRQSLELLNDAAKEAKAREVEEKAEELQRFRTNTTRTLRRERDRITKEILHEIQQTVEQYAKTNNFAMVLDERSLLYGVPAHDLTNDILKILNSRVAAAAPAAP
jgi:outer membrane protein